MIERRRTSTAAKSVAMRLPMGIAGAWLVLVIALLATAWEWHLTKMEVLERSQLRFDSRVDQVTSAISNRMQNYQQMLTGGTALFAAVKDVSRGQWATYVTKLHIERNYPGIQGIGFAKRVQADEHAAHIEKVRSEGFSHYSIQPPGERKEYFPIIYLEPFSGRNLRAFGYDMFSEKVRNAAMQQARDSGLATLSGKVTLVQETHEDRQAGFLMYLPVYREGASLASVEQRRAALLGFVYSPFRMHDLMRGSLGTLGNDIDLDIFDGRQMNAASLMYDAANDFETSQETPNAFSKVLPLEIAGHTWTIRLKSLPSFEKSMSSNEPIIILISGLILSGLLFTIAWSLATTRSRAVALANRMTAALRRSYAELQGVHNEMEAFSYSVSHDLRAPLRSIDGFSHALLEECGQSLSAQGEDYLRRIRRASQRMSALIDALLNLSRLSRSGLNWEKVNLTALVQDISEHLQQRQPERHAQFIIAENVQVAGDPLLMRVLMENLLDNAWKFTGNNSSTRIEFGVYEQNAERVYFVKDNGVGFDMEYVDKLFGAFQRLHSNEEFAGTGIGLATVRRIISRHGGEVWTTAKVGEGATFYFTLAQKPSPSNDALLGQ